ncbi:MAG: outer membrane protein [Desulfobaccales bacterium]
MNPAFNVAVGVVGFLAASAIGYGLYETKMRPDQPRLLNGEFYGGGYLGASFAPDQNLSYKSGATFNNGVTQTHVGSFTVANNKFDTGVAGGIKFGYFFNSIPYLGLEGETNVSPNRVSTQTVSVSPAVLGRNQLIMPAKDWINWTSALHIVGRYGFFKDSEVPFGRLQPYVGIGPAVVAMYDPEDSAKNFAIDAMAGIRFMMLKNVSAFVEYKYNHQFSPEMEIHQIVTNNFAGQGMATLSGYDLHRVIAGVTYHW